MAFPIAQHAKLNATEYQGKADFNVVKRLMEDPRYEIPRHLRNKVLQQAEDCMDSEKTSFGDRLAAGRLVLECDKRNIELVKLAMPKVVIHKDAKDYTDEELEALVKDTLALMPPEKVIDVPANSGTSEAL